MLVKYQSTYREAQVKVKQNGVYVTPLKIYIKVAGQYIEDSNLVVEFLDSNGFLFGESELFSDAELWS